jgi:hypothetical protein
MVDDNVMYVGRYPASMLLDILSDGIDWSARGFWAQVEKFSWYWWYVRDDKGEPDMNKVSPDLTPDTVLMKVRDDEDGEANEEHRVFTPITLNDLAQSTDWALEEYSHLFGYSVSKGKIVDIDYDAIGADVIIQKIVLGEVIYG